MEVHRKVQISDKNKRITAKEAIQRNEEKTVCEMIKIDFIESSGVKCITN